MHSLLQDDQCPLKQLFSGPLQYSQLAFRQAVLMYEEVANDLEFDSICEEVAAQVTMHPEFVRLLDRVAGVDHTKAVVITCGVRRVWEKVLRNIGVSDYVKVIGSGRVADGYVVTAEVKAELVRDLRFIRKKEVWAFGDSILDIPMMKLADRAIVVVCNEVTRSKSMEKALRDLLDDSDSQFQAHQLLLPADSQPRLDFEKLPLFDLNILVRGSSFVHATDCSAAKLLMAPMRDAKNSGHVLREAHRRVGWYLSTEFVTKMIGVETYEMDHVQGGKTDGHRLRNEKRTTIVPLMRGGEPMAFGVSEAFPLAWFVHAKEPKQLEAHHILKQKTILLVDSVINNGTSVIEFVEHIRYIDAHVRIIVITGVVQAKAMSLESGGAIAKLLEEDLNVDVVALRMSDNKYTGKGGTDTGHRLFNTTHLD